MNFDWKSIRAIDDSQKAGFEELVVQLARDEVPANARFVRVGVLDAGVECYCVLEDGSEWGWQAKFFTSSLTDGQWGELDRSVKASLDSHPNLTRYFVCIPWNRSHSPRPGQTTAKQKWDAHVSKWQGWAKDKDMDVDFDWWGSSELIEHLSREEHVGTVFFWFQEQYFSKKWYSDRLDQAITSADKRYTPEAHVDLPIALNIDMFGRTDSALNRVKAIARDFRSEFRGIIPSIMDDDTLRQSPELSELLQARDAILTEFSALQPSPTGDFPVASIAEKVETAAQEPASKYIESLDTLADEFGLKSAGKDDRNPYRDMYYRVIRLARHLTTFRAELIEAHQLVNRRVMILKGKAGTGKTHLLCDVTRKRLEAGAPTVLFMGQRFTDSSPPWTQALQMFDMSGAKAEQFVGALECSARVSNRRALLIIDALNEGTGSEIWPPHLSAFLSQVTKSPWIDVILSVRSSYEEDIIPDTVREIAITITHQGFDGHEDEALKIFSESYGIEFPSAPILQPEFANPLLLKMVCEGLQTRGERRFPRGFRGVTAIFDRYIDDANNRLAKSLDYNPNDNLVRQALEAVAGQTIGPGSNMRWLPRQEAERVVNEFLPTSGYSNSLYHALISEGLLTDEGTAYTGESQEVVRFAYERFLDHISVNFLLGKYMDPSNPGAAFEEGGGLAFLCDEKVYVPYGILEAMFVQVPERTGQELLRVAPRLVESHLFIASEFLSSIVWRSIDALSEDTLVVLDELAKKESLDRDDIMDAILTVSTVPEHPLNANWLNRKLRRDSMTERDVWWSTYLHRAWEYNKGPVHRLVDWANSISPSSTIDDEVVDLSANALAWMLTTSNRFLRDRATKALVCLLTGRFDALVRLVNDFDDVDDPYVRERVYAIAYGVAMRSNDASQVEKIGHAVYENIFKTDSPPAHILLRDYASGVVERALYLNPSLDIDERLIRPPFKSEWPGIPEEDTLESLFPPLTDGEGKPGRPEVARNRIRSSVMGYGDFARYVIGVDIGVNSTSRSSRWLEKRVGEELWNSYHDRLEKLLHKMNEKERSAYKEFKETEFSILGQFALMLRLLNTEPDGMAEMVIEAPKESDEQIALAFEQLLSALSEDNRHEMEKLWETRNLDATGFDTSLIQRYILGRVFDLGWTVDRFGYFDSTSIRYSGRQANKAERVGKKYQWIAYHEILAYLSDHYQHRGWSGASSHVFRGAWQDSFRDLDPSNTLPATKGGTSWEGHTPSWWANSPYDDWQEDVSHQKWLGTEDDIPDVKDLLQVSRGDNRDEWFVAEGHFTWRQDHPADEEPYENPRRDLWIACRGYFIRREDADEFITWAKGVDFRGRWMPEPADAPPSDMYLGEFLWSPAFDDLMREIESSRSDVIADGDKKKCPVTLRTAALRYFAESGGFDCSVEEGYGMYIPQPEFVVRNELEWGGAGADFIDQQGKVVASDPSVYEDGPGALLLRGDVLFDYLRKEQVALCWVIMGEKVIVGEEDFDNRHDIHKLSGAYILTENGLDGFLDWMGTS